MSRRGKAGERAQVQTGQLQAIVILFANDCETGLNSLDSWISHPMPAHAALFLASQANLTQSYHLILK